MSFDYCVWPDRICFYCIRRDVCRLTEWCALVIRRSILHVLPCCPIRLAGPVCCPGPWYFCLSGDGVQVELQAETPLWLGHEVAGQPHRKLVNEVSMLPPRGEVATCALGSSWRGVRVHTLRPQGLQSICRLANLDQL